MQNVSEEKINSLESEVNSFYKELNNSVSWVNNHLKYEEKEEVSLMVKNIRRVVRKIGNSIHSKPVFAMYGASQVGKSYLIKNLLSSKGNSLKICNGDQKIDFLKDINPPGIGAESTGVVTRFTIDKPSDNDNYPIKINLLDVKDLIIILSDSYFSDIKKIEEYPKEANFIELIEDLENKFQTSDHVQEILSEDDVLDIREYFNQNFERYSHEIEGINKSRYWDRIGVIIEKIPSVYWKDTFGIFWGKNKFISALFSLLITELEKLKFARTIYAPFSAVLRGEGEILNVKKLKELYKNEKSTMVFCDGAEVSINESVLSGLSSELVLQISLEKPESKAFLQNTDLLDFPGARSRLEVESDTISNETTPDMLLRGKIAYLFNKYSSDFEINNLLFCINDKQLDVNELPGLLNSWIGNNIGATPEERFKTINHIPVSPLFVIFTFFNNQLNFDSTNDTEGEYDYKWDTRFRRFFENEIVTSSYDWHKNWSQNGTKFSNFFLLRDFKYSEDTYDGYEETGVEALIRPERQEFFTELGESFLSHPFVQEYFENPGLSWNESTQLNKDGSELIIKNLEPAANNFVKLNNYITLLQDNKKELLSSFSKYYHNNNLKDKRVLANNQANDFQVAMNRIIGKNPLYFSEFVKLIFLPENIAFN
jgi:hypothetical protein